MNNSRCIYCKNTFLSIPSFIFLLFVLALSGCDAPSNGLVEQGESSQTVTEKVVTAQSMGYDLKVTDLGSFIPSGINDAGQIAGWSETDIIS